MLRQWLESASAETVLPEIISERCVHSLVEVAGCRACVDACPKGAWQISDDSLGIDSAACDGCGLCAAACPQAVIISDHEPLVVQHKGVSLALARCDKTGKRGDSLPLMDREIACVHALGYRELARLVAGGVSVLSFFTGECDDCSRGGSTRLWQRVSRLNRLWADDDQPRLKIYPMSEQQWHGLLETLDPARQGERLSRRAFFTWGLSRVSTQLLPALQLAAAEREAIRTPAQILSTARNSAKSLVSPVIDSVKCDGCDACVKLCPHATIKFERQAQSARYVIEPQTCTGCGLCVDICENGAVWLESPGSAQAFEINLQSGQCAICGVPFHQPADNSGEISHCRICRQVNHKRNLFQVLS